MAIVREREKSHRDLWSAVDFGRFIEAWPGPALLFHELGEIIVANEAANAILPLVASGGALEAVAISAAQLGHGERRLAKARSVDGQIVWETSIVCAGPGLALVTARDVTLERNLIDALTRSREMYRDLVLCSSDLAWETDADGIFTFVSDRGALGYSAGELFGFAAATLLDSDRNFEGHNPFASRHLLDDAETWVTDRDGDPACVLVSCVPIGTADTGWQGCRGVLRDVTDERLQAAALQRALARERLLDSVTDAMANAVDPNHALQVAANATLNASGAAAVAVLSTLNQGAIEIAARAGVPDMPVMPASLGPDNVESPRPVVDEIDGLFRVVAQARNQGRRLGAISILRSEPWRADDLHLVEGVASQLGIALAQVDQYCLLERISRTDALTGLLNRRAFDDELDRRLAHADRTGRKGVLVFVDLDNFKQVNDRFGHGAGDRVLIGVGRILVEGLRVADLAARFGGDEFAMWLEETDEVGGKVVVDRLLGSLGALNGETFGPGYDPARALGLSIGVACYAPGLNEDSKHLVARADAAMYAVKQAGKHGYRLAPAIEDVP